MFGFTYYSLYSLYFYVVLPATLFYYSDLFWKASIVGKHDRQHCTLNTSSAETRGFPEMASPQSAPQSTRRGQRKPLQPRPQVEDVEFPVMTQPTSYPQLPSRSSRYKSQTKRNPILEQAASIQYPRSPNLPDYQYETSPTLAPKPNSPRLSTQVGYERPASPLTNILPDILTNIASSIPDSFWLPPFPVADWSGILQNFAQSKEVPQYQDMCQHQEIPKTPQFHSAFHPQDEVMGEPDDLPLQEPEAQLEYKPWFNLRDMDYDIETPVTVIDDSEDVVMDDAENLWSESRDVDHDMENQVMEDAEDVYNQHRNLDDMDTGIDANLVPAPWMDTPATHRPLFWEEPKQHYLTQKQPEFVRIINVLMVLQNQFQEACTYFARNSLILLARNLVNQILDVAIILQTQNECTPLSDAYANCIRFWTEKIVDIQSQIPAPAKTATHYSTFRSEQPLPEAPSMMSFSKDSSEDLSQSQSAFFDAMVVTWP